MTTIGPVLAAFAVTAFLLAVRPASSVARRLELIAPPRARIAPRWGGASEVDLRHAGIDLEPARFSALKIAAGLASALSASLASLVLPLGPLVVAVAAYLGFVVPSLVVEQRAASRRAHAERETTVLVERLEALVAAGRPPESALSSLVGRRTGVAILDGALERVRDGYALGAPLFRTLATIAREDGLPALAGIAGDLERARDLGTGSLGVIRQRREALRAGERTRAMEAAARVEGKLMLILVLCYLPALVLLVVIPLFVGILDGLSM